MPKPIAVADNPLPEFIRRPNGDVEIRFGEFQQPVVVPASAWVDAVYKVSRTPNDRTLVRVAALHGLL